MDRAVYKDCHLKATKVCTYLDTAAPNSRILIVFWHGLGDTLMFLPLFSYVQQRYPQLVFTLGLLPGVGQHDFLKGQYPTTELAEADFLAHHDAAFVISFPMNEGGTDVRTKVVYCANIELGLAVPRLAIPSLRPQRNRLVGLHLQGTCLPGSTNPDDVVARRLWDDVLDAGFVPIDLHFCHVFHNPVNEAYPWAYRHCRDLSPNIATLQMMLERCCAVLAVASGPFVLAASIMHDKLIYLQKSHDVRYYMNDAPRVLNLDAYSDMLNPGRHLAEQHKLWAMLWAIEEKQ